MSFGTLALICACGLAGPLLAAGTRGTVPAVVGEILAGVIIGKTGFDVLETADATLSFLSNLGFAMLMFAVGMNVPLRDARLRASLGAGAVAAAATGALAIGAGLLAAHIGSGQAAIYAVILGSSSAAVALPIIQERGLTGGTVLTVIAWTTIADILATIAIPFVLAPSRIAHTAGGTLLVAACVLATFTVAARLRRLDAVKALRKLSKRRRWALDLRLALLILVGLCWIAQEVGASLLIAGFGTGLVVAAIGGPKRLSTEVLGIGQGFFIPLFFVVLGAKLDLSALVTTPSIVRLALALAVLNVLVHVLASRLTRQGSAAGMVACAELGVPAAVIALGLPAHAITPAQAAAIFAASLVSIGVCSVGALLLARSAVEDTPPPVVAAG